MQLKSVIPDSLVAQYVLSVISLATLPCVLPEQVMMGMESNRLIVDEQSSGQFFSNKLMDLHLEF